MTQIYILLRLISLIVSNSEISEINLCNNFSGIHVLLYVLDRLVTKKLKEFVDQKRVARAGDKANMRDLSQMIKKNLTRLIRVCKLAFVYFNTNHTKERDMKKLIVAVMLVAFAFTVAYAADVVTYDSKKGNVTFLHSLQCFKRVTVAFLEIF